RRHTRFSRDWSSDVCSSDLNARPIRDVLSHHNAAKNTSPCCDRTNFLHWCSPNRTLLLPLYLPRFRNSHAARDSFLKALVLRCCYVLVFPNCHNKYILIALGTI